MIENICMCKIVQPGFGSFPQRQRHSLAVTYASCLLCRCSSRHMPGRLDTLNLPMSEAMLTSIMQKQVDQGFMEAYVVASWLPYNLMSHKYAASAVPSYLLSPNPPAFYLFIPLCKSNCSSLSCCYALTTLPAPWSHLYLTSSRPARKP